MTGATGFVGSHLVERLVAQGWRVTALTRATSDVRRLDALGVERVVADLADAAGLGRAIGGHDVVLHLAAATRARSQKEYDAANVDGTAALMRAVADAPNRPGRAVYLSSLAAAGPALDGEPVSEQDPPHPVTAYGRSKLQGERVFLATPGIATVALRAPAVYGPRDRDLFTFFRLASYGLMPVPMGPDRLLQLIHVHDLAEAAIAAAKSESGAGVYNVAEPAAYRWSSISRMIADAVGRRRTLRVPLPRTAVKLAAAVVEGAAGLVGRATIFNRDKAKELLAPGWLCTTQKAARELNFETSIPLARGVTETAEWYRQNGWLDG